MKADLHLHTTASDGKLSPSQLVSLAASLDLDVIAITDHDSVGGVDEALNASKSYPGLTVVPGLEINTDIPGDELHILGFFVDHKSPELQSALEMQRAGRVERGHEMVAKLAALGMPLEWERVLELSHGDSIGRPHIAQAMLEKGYITNLGQAFYQYIGRNGPAYVERERMAAAQAVALVARTGGLPALAHPAEAPNLDSLLMELKASGLGALEAYYTGYSIQKSQRLEALARRLGLLVCGGSDYHGLDESRESKPGSVFLPKKAVQSLLAWKDNRC